MVSKAPVIHFMKGFCNKNALTVSDLNWARPYRFLEMADRGRVNDYDGRGNLSDAGLGAF